MLNRKIGVMKTETPITGRISMRPSRKSVGPRNYNENLMDDLIEKHLGSVPRKKCRTVEEMEKETQTEAMIALSLGFPIDELLEEEIKAGVVSELGGVEQNNYIVVRNHILTKWRDNVHIWLSKGHIRETVSSEYETLICAAYDFLISRGYINFGVSPSISSHVSCEASDGSVIIVGAGLAGLAAARQLLSFGFKVVVLEGRKRPGGRVYTQKIGQKGNFAAVDLGGSVITGIHANPLGVLARQLSIPLHKVRDKCPLHKPNGAPVVEEMDSRVESIFNKLLDKATQLRQILGEFARDISLGMALETFRQIYGVAQGGDEKQLLNWHLANLEYANASQLSDLSVVYWDQDDPYEMGGDHCLLAGGNARLVDALCESVPIFYRKTVHSIKYGKDGVEVVAGNQVFRADMVLCTVPLGVLKKKVIRFEPELPTRKLDAIKRLGFGLLNKVAMVFPFVFWGEDLDTFGYVNKDSHKRGEFFLFYSYHMVSGGPALIALVAGESALTFEQTDPTVLLHRVLIILRGIYGPRGIDVPNPIQTICTRWGSDSHCFGSYSHVGVGSSGEDYDILAESVGDGRLLFAGEATNRQYPASMHGAFLSGLREASRILTYAKNRKLDPGKCLPRNMGPFDETLALLYQNPDLSFGKFSFVFNPATYDPKSLGLMRITLKKSNNTPCRNCSSGEKIKEGSQQSPNLELQLYSILSREQAGELQLLKEENDSKCLLALKNLGLKLVGHNALGELGSSAEEADW
ncbi:lysine-specific histone demethylase 1 homolog 2 isoform X2 [Aristolochia californica]|uniref:lysine-specific histone demethylase 1 homolog 2 isoform X2 n=1 Tax=Aristolochia californica TaxID=171875 RepID=UPI0035E1631F